MTKTEQLKTCNLKVLLGEVKSISRVLRKLEIKPTPYAYKIIKNRINQEKLEYKPEYNAITPRAENKVDWLSLATKNSNILSMYQFKRFLERSRLIGSNCAICSAPPIHNDIKLTLQLDHVDGDRTNNEISNLRLLCPNCHSQTDNFAGRNNKKLKMCTKCSQNPVETKYAIYCKNCKKYVVQEAASKEKKTKIVWPDKDKLQRMLWEQSTISIAKILNVSDKAVEKHAKKLGLTKPGRGYWTTH